MPKKIPELTVLGIKNAKPADYPLRDGKGLMLIRTESGTLYWRLKYRLQDGRESMKALGEYPKVSLSAVRDDAHEVRKLIKDGKDPAAEERAKKARERLDTAGSFPAVVEAWMEWKRPSWAESTHAKARLVFDDYLLPALHRTTIAALTSRQVSDVLEEMHDKVPSLARKARQYMNQLTEYAIRKGLREDGKMLVLRGVLSRRDKGNIPAATEVKEVTELVKAIALYPSPVTRHALTLAMLTAMRPGIVATAEWSEIDLQAAEWHVPGAKMKMRHAHIAPLPKQAIAVLEEMRTYTAGRAFVFPPLARQNSPHLSRDALSKALREMGFRGRHATHGFRAMLRTVARERLKIDVDVLEAQLAHAKKGEVQQAYDRTKFLDERREGMQRWADYLDALREA